MHKFRELKVWQRSMDLIVEVYHLTQTFPQAEQFGLISRRLSYCTDQQVNALLQEADEIAAMIVGLSKSLSEK